MHATKLVTFSPSRDREGVRHCPTHNHYLKLYYSDALPHGRGSEPSRRVDKAQRVPHLPTNTMKSPTKPLQPPHPLQELLKSKPTQYYAPHPNELQQCYVTIQHP